MSLPEPKDHFIIRKACEAKGYRGFNEVWCKFCLGAKEEELEAEVKKAKDIRDQNELKPHIANDLKSAVTKTGEMLGAYTWKPNNPVQICQKSRCTNPSLPLAGNLFCLQCQGE